MTFDEWMLTVAPAHKPSDDSVTLRVLRQCWNAAQGDERKRLLAELRTMHAQQNGRHNYCLYAAEMLAGKL